MRSHEVPCSAQCGHSVVLSLGNLFSSQRISAPEKESVTCGGYTEEETYSGCDRAEVSRCLLQCCGQDYRPLWAGDRLEQISTDLPRQEAPTDRCKQFLLGEETPCLPPCTNTKVKVSSVL